MINLIPPQARKHILREYWTRVGSVWMLLLGSVAIVVALLLVPSYVLIAKQSSALSEVAAEALSKNEDYEASAVQITEANRRGALLVQETADMPITVLMDRIEELSGVQVTINEMRFTRTDAGVLEPVVVVGTAATRADLATYRNQLEASQEFNTVDLPLSNLAKDVDVQFSMTITLAASDTAS